MVAAVSVTVAPAATALISDTCIYDAGTKIATVLFPSGANQSRTVSRQPGGNKIFYNGSQCQTASVNNTNTVYVITDTGTQTLTIDLSDGPFAPGATAEAAGTSEIEFEVDLGAGTDGINVYGGGGSDKLAFQGTTKLLLNGDADSDVHLLSAENRWLYGGSGNDVLKASPTSPPAEFYGGGGNDTLTGGGGSDDLTGEAGADTLAGGPNDDNLYGGGGGDTLKGGDGDDYAIGGDGDDLFDAGYGDDSFYSESAGDGADRMIGGPGTYDQFSYDARSVKVTADLDGTADDGENGEKDRLGIDVETIDGGAGNDVLTGNNQDNYLDGGPGADELKGGNGDDGLYGYEGADTLRGGPGSDDLAGGTQNDDLNGDAGNDLIYAENTEDGDDDIRGGDGSDTVYYYGRTATTWIRLGSTNEGGSTEHDIIHSDVENGYGGSGNDIMAGTGKDNYLQGNAGSDTIDGGAGADSLAGGLGGDVLTGGDGYDYVYGNDDNDTLHLNDAGTDYANCGAGVDDASDNDIYDTTLTDCEAT
jgi:Ca2+-binding RTX toxin-like protein